MDYIPYPMFEYNHEEASHSSLMPPPLPCVQLFGLCCLLLAHYGPVPRSTLCAEPLAILDHDEEDRRSCHADKRGRDEAVLVAQIRQPGGNSVIVS